MSSRKNTLARKNLHQSRAGMYGFLSRLYRIEADQELIEQLAELDLGEYLEDVEMKKGYELLKGYLEQGADLEELAVDYAKVFLGVGPKQGEGAFPYESVYTSPRALLMQDARDQVVELYQREGLVRDPEINEPEDHLAFELIFMSYLSQKAIEAIDNNLIDEITQYEQKQEDFLQKHLLNWVPRFCTEVGKISDTSFYKGIALLTNGFLNLDAELLKLDWLENQYAEGW